MQIIDASHLKNITSTKIAESAFSHVLSRTGAFAQSNLCKGRFTSSKKENPLGQDILGVHLLPSIRTIEEVSVNDE